MHFIPFTGKSSHFGWLAESLSLKTGHLRERRSAEEMDCPQART